jgi:hypothetical protein
MSQRRPLSLIAIVAWSLVVCLGVSAQAAGNRDQAGNRDNAAYIEQPGAPNPNAATQVQQGLGSNALTPFAESDLPQTPPPAGYYDYQGQQVPGYVPSTQGPGLGLGMGLGVGGSRNR